MTAQRRNEIVGRISDSKKRQLAEINADCLHPCVWLVQDEDGPLQAGGRPRLPEGQPWPRIDGKPLAYLLSVPAVMLPEWSPLPRGSGHVLLFVGPGQAVVVMVPSGSQTREMDPPLDNYLGKDPTAGETLEVMRFRLEEGLHAGLPESLQAAVPAGRDAEENSSRVEEVREELEGELQPEDAIGRLFGAHEQWVGIDAGDVLRWSYLAAHGHGEACYVNLERPADRLEQELAEAREKPTPVTEPLPPLSDIVLQVALDHVRKANELLAQESAEAAAGEAADLAAKNLARRQSRWEWARTNRPDEEPEALQELIEYAADVLRTYDKANGSKRTEDPLGSEIIRMWEATRAAGRTGDCDAIRARWAEHEQTLNEHAVELSASNLAFALRERIEQHERLQGWLRRGYVAPDSIARQIEAVRWWQSDVARHEKELAHWRPLFVMLSSSSPYFWGDAGVAIILADDRQIAAARFEPMAIVVDVS